ncbi:MAG TPA: FAD/NAD(P)-binding protein [Gaiellaceae bacterium]|nr:FAD/NAD(P)-binding protein [Gaiellaceae bacterium]
MATTAEPVELARGAMTPLPYRVVRKRRENHDNWTLELEPVGAALDPIGPGQFTMLYAFGVGEVPISSSGDPAEPRRLVHTIRAVGAVTKALCALRPGDVLGARGPFGNRWPLEVAERRDLVLVGGGVGLPPLRPVLYHALAHRGTVGELVLLYGGRTPADLLFTRELARWRGRLDLHVDVTVDAARSDWRGRVGVVTKLIPGARFEPDEAVAFVVGPEVMMRFTARALLDRGVTPERIWVSMERTMRCGVGLCGHCQLGPTLICRDGPVYRWDEIEPLLEVHEL